MPIEFAEQYKGTRYEDHPDADSDAQPIELGALVDEHA